MCSDSSLVSLVTGRSLEPWVPGQDGWHTYSIHPGHIQSGHLVWRSCSRAGQSYGIGWDPGAGRSRALPCIRSKRKFWARVMEHFTHVTCRVGQGWGTFDLPLQFDKTLGFQGEGPSVTQTIQVGSVSITSWGFLRDELSAPDSPILKGQIWAIQEHKLSSDDQRAAIEDRLKAFGIKTFLQPGVGHRVGWVDLSCLDSGC